VWYGEGRMTKPEFKKTADEIVRYGFGRFTGWAHHFEN
jgi:hypothetical protein